MPFRPKFEIKQVINLVILIYGRVKFGKIKCENQCSFHFYNNNWHDINQLDKINNSLCACTRPDF